MKGPKISNKADLASETAKDLEDQASLIDTNTMDVIPIWQS